MSSTMPPPTYLANEDRGKGLVIFISVMSVLATLCVVGRFVSRAMSCPGSQFSPRLWWDDWIALLSLCINWPSAAIGIRMYQLGLGRHLWTIPEENLKSIFRYTFIAYFTYDAGLALAKASALLFYSRVFVARSNRRLRYAIYVVHAMNISWLIALYIANFAQCNPVAKNWDPFLSGKCSPVADLWLGSAIPSVVIDLLILLLPLPMTWNLSLSRGKKLGLIIVFLLGYCTIVISIGRVVSSIKLRTKLDEDLTYAGIPVFYWLCAEIPVTIISICLPAMLNLGRRVTTSFTPLQSFISSYISSRSSSTAPSLRTQSARSTDLSVQTEKEHMYSQPKQSATLIPNRKTYTVSATGDSVGNTRKAAGMYSTEQKDEGVADAQSLSSDGIHMHREFSVISIDQNDRTQRS